MALFDGEMDAAPPAVAPVPAVENTPETNSPPTQPDPSTANPRSPPPKAETPAPKAETPAPLLTPAKVLSLPSLQIGCRRVPGYRACGGVVKVIWGSSGWAIASAWQAVHGGSHFKSASPLGAYPYSRYYLPRAPASSPSLSPSPSRLVPPPPRFNP